MGVAGGPWNSPRQSDRQYTGTLLVQFKHITEKMREAVTAAKVEPMMAFLATVY